MDIPTVTLLDSHVLLTNEMYKSMANGDTDTVGRAQNAALDAIEPLLQTLSAKGLAAFAPVKAEERELALCSTDEAIMWISSQLATDQLTSTPAERIVYTVGTYNTGNSLCTSSQILIEGATGLWLTHCLGAVLGVAAAQSMSGAFGDIASGAIRFITAMVGPDGNDPAVLADIAKYINLSGRSFGGIGLAAGIMSKIKDIIWQTYGLGVTVYNLDTRHDMLITAPFLDNALIPGTQQGSTTAWQDVIISKAVPVGAFHIVLLAGSVVG